MRHQLYLLRHAQSADKQIGQSDLERGLTHQGMRQSMLIGNFLREEKLIPDCIVCSTAERAKATANIIRDVLRLDSQKVFFEETLFEASPRIYFEFISQLSEDFKNVLCIGHNPTVSYVAEYLTKAEIGDMAPAGAAIIEFNALTWQDVSAGNGELIRYVYPEMLE